MDSKLLVYPGTKEQLDLVELTSPQAHKGMVRKMIYTQIDGLSVLITASADRTIKLWEPKNNKTNKCFQTIIGHKGSILDMVYIEKVQLLVTSSTDRTMRIWRIDKARQLLMYPWFVEFQRAH
jgi:WD40 repeat protein